MLVFGVGASGIVHHNTHVNHTVGIASVEYRADHRIFGEMKPLAGAFATSDGSVYVHGGIYRDWNFAARWSLTAHLAAGAYGHGDKNDLCNPLQFQEGVDLMHRFNKGWRLGASLRHLSNGGTGSCNPGSETLALFIAVPLR